MGVVSISNVFNGWAVTEKKIKEEEKMTTVTEFEDGSFNLGEAKGMSFKEVMEGPESRPTLRMDVSQNVKNTEGTVIVERLEGNKVELIGYLCSY